MSQRQTAIDFLQMCALKNPVEAFAKYTNANFKHHNQHFPGDGPSLAKAMVDADREQPNKSFTIKQVYETDDRIAVYSQVVKDSMEIAVVHMLRFENGKISEMWDVGQVMIKDSPNRSGMF